MRKEEREMMVARDEAEKMKELVGEDGTKEDYDAASELRDEYLSDVIEKSPMKEAYALLGARTPLELYHLYSEEDQKILREKGFLGFDYNDPDLITNKVKDILEVANPEELTADEQEWRKGTLWFWYHHAISAAITRGNKEKAQEFSEKALEFEDRDNKITRLLYYLVHDRRKDAEEHVQMMAEENDSDAESAKELLEEFYKQNPFKDEKGEFFN